MPSICAHLQLADLFGDPLPEYRSKRLVTVSAKEVTERGPIRYRKKIDLGLSAEMDW